MFCSFAGHVHKNLRSCMKPTVLKFRIPEDWCKRNHRCWEVLASNSCSMTAKKQDEKSVISQFWELGLDQSLDRVSGGLKSLAKAVDKWGKEYTREEKSLRHVAMVAKFLDDNKPKRHLKSGFALFHWKLHRSYLISFNLSNVGEISWVKSERTVSKFRKRKRTFLYCVHVPCKAKFHVAVAQQRLRNVQKSVMHVQSFSFANLNLLLKFCCSRRRCKNSLLLWSTNFATVVTWRHTFPL